MELLSSLTPSHMEEGPMNRKTELREFGGAWLLLR